MGTKLGNYKEEQAGYIKVLVGLLLLTAVTFIQPHMFLTNVNLEVQLFIGVVKAYLILAYYMHLKGETQIIWFTSFSLIIVATFFIIVIGMHPLPAPTSIRIMDLSLFSLAFISFILFCQLKLLK